MDYGRVMYLTYLIKNDVSGRSGVLKEIYERAVRESDSFRELLDLRQECLFFENGIGESMAKEADLLLESIFREPGKGPDTLEQMHRLTRGIRREEARSLEILRGGDLTESRVSVIRRTDAEIYGQMLDRLASVFTFVILISGKRSVLSTVRWNPEHSINEKLRLLNQELIGSVLGSAEEIPFWRIVRRDNTERLRFCDSLYNLEWIPYQQYLSGIRGMTPLRENVYVCEEMEKEKSEGTVYLGMGRITSCHTEECMQRLQQEPLVREEKLITVTDEAARRCVETGLYPTLDAVTDGALYAVSPDRAVSLLNQMAAARRITERREKGICLFCGTPVTGRLVCPGHLRVERI